MPTQTLKIKSSVDTELVMSFEEYLINYLTDIPTRGLGGQRLNDLVIERKIKIAAQQIENLLSVKLTKQKISESQDFDAAEFKTWGFIRTNYLIMELKALQGKLNMSAQIIYPTSWMSYNRSLDKMRVVHIVAGQQESGVNGTSQQTYVAVFSNAFPLFGRVNSTYIPNYWYMEYVTGWDKVPMEITDAIGKIISTQVLAIMGDVAFGAGIASKSISIDGASESVSTTQSAENSLYSARIRQYANELQKEDLPRLRQRYTSPTMFSL